MPGAKALPAHLPLARGLSDRADNLTSTETKKILCGDGAATPQQSGAWPKDRHEDRRGWTKRSGVCCARRERPWECPKSSSGRLAARTRRTSASWNADGVRHRCAPCSISPMPSEYVRPNWSSAPNANSDATWQPTERNALSIRLVVSCVSTHQAFPPAGRAGLANACSCHRRWRSRAAPAQLPPNPTVKRALWPIHVVVSQVRWRLLSNSAFSASRRASARGIAHVEARDKWNLTSSTVKRLNRHPSGLLMR